VQKPVWQCALCDSEHAPNSRYCHYCRAYQAKRKKISRVVKAGTYRERRAQGLCGASGCPRKASGSLCPRCLRKVLLLRALREAARYARNVCTSCGTRPREARYKQCAVCRIRARDYHRDWIAAQRATGDVAIH